MEEWLLLVLAPLCALALVLAWAWLLVTRRRSFRMCLKGLGISINLESDVNTSVKVADEETRQAG